ncbi:MAG: 50S ribosomal protein L34 [Phycisphaerae bacterium]|nr:50S ribosomal protein L34 [Phycisphaerae bacterium]
MHYPRKISRRHRKRKIGFLVRMRTSKGRKMLNRKRRAGRKLQVV